MPTLRPILAATALLLATSACQEDSPRPTGPVPMRAPSGTPRGSVAPELAAQDATDTSETGETGEAEPTVVLPERPRADPDIDRALDRISASGLRFVDPPSEPDARPSEYTAEQFAAMLRTKWDWIGYDLTELEPWLEQIATRSFKTNLAYQVLHTDGTMQELRPWLDAQLNLGAADDE